MTRLRTDIVDVYVCRQESGGAWTLLQLRRAAQPMAGTWQPVMGHAEPGERAMDAAVRELREETGLAPGAGLVRLHQLEQVHPYLLADRDEIVLSPRFCATAEPRWEPVLDEEHDAARWVPAESAREEFLWPGQAAAVAEILGVILATSGTGPEAARAMLLWPQQG